MFRDITNQVRSRIIILYTSTEKDQPVESPFLVIWDNTGFMYFHIGFTLEKLKVYVHFYKQTMGRQKYPYFVNVIIKHSAF